MDVSARERVGERNIVETELPSLFDRYFGIKLDF